LDKGGTVRAGIMIFSMEEERKSLHVNRTFLYTTKYYQCCNIIVLNVHAPSEEKIVDPKDSLYQELEQVSSHFPKYHMKILLGDFNAKLRRENIFKLTIRIERVHQDSNDNDVSELCHIRKSSC